VVTDPQTQTQTGPITIHCAAKLSAQCNEQEAQLMLTTGSTRLAVNQGQQT